MGKGGPTSTGTNFFTTGCARDLYKLVSCGKFADGPALYPITYPDPVDKVSLPVQVCYNIFAEILLPKLVH
jgi:hypothetical protein